MSDSPGRILSLLASFTTISLLAVGGGSAVLPEMQAAVVEQTHWLSNDQFKEIYSLGQVAPGPNMTMVAVIGKHVAGWPGVLAAVLGFFVPSSLLAFAVNRIWHRLEPWPWLDSIQAGLAPVAIGLMIAGVWLLARLAINGVSTGLIATVATLILLARKPNPLWLILGGAAVELFRVW